MAEVNVFDPSNYKSLVASGDKVWDLLPKLGINQSHQLDDATITVELWDGTMVAIAELGSTSLAGFGAMMGVAEELSSVYPNGAKMKLSHRAVDGGSKTTLSITGKTAGEMVILGLADPRIPEHLTMATRIDQAHGARDAYVLKLSTPEVVVSTASFVLALADHAVQQDTWFQP